MSDPSAGAPRVPLHIALFSPILDFLLRVGIPLGPNMLITIRGRTSGLPRTTGVAVIRVAGRRWVWAPWGEVHWVRNLRTAGRATITVRRRSEEVTAIELDKTERIEFFRDVLGPYARSCATTSGYSSRRPAVVGRGRSNHSPSPSGTSSTGSRHGSRPRSM